MKIKFLFFTTIFTVAIMSGFALEPGDQEQREGLEYDSVTDSIGYWMECARADERWAFEKLAECYRYGKGGMDQSVFNTLVCYHKADKKVKRIFDEAYQNNPLEEFGLINHLMNGLLTNAISREDAVGELKGFPQPLPKSIALMRRLLEDAERQELSTDSILLTFDDNTTTDEYLVAFGLCLVFENKYESIDDLPDTPEATRVLEMMAEKIPIANNMLGSRYLNRYLSDKSLHKEYLERAFECFYKADRYGLLREKEAVRLLEYKVEINIDSLSPFSPKDIARLMTKYEKKLFQPALPVGVFQEDPVELIEE